MKYLFLIVAWAAHAGDFDRAIAEQEVRRGIPRGLLYQIVQVESQFRPDAINKTARVKSYGLAQLTEDTAMEICMLPLSQIMDPKRNLDCGGRVLMLLLQKYTVEHAVAAYNSGTPCLCSNNKEYHYTGPNGEDYGSCGGKCTTVGTIRNARYINLVLNATKPTPTIVSPAPRLPGIPVHAR
jgi:hypothetical protein